MLQDFRTAFSKLAVWNRFYSFTIAPEQAAQDADLAASQRQLTDLGERLYGVLPLSSYVNFVLAASTAAVAYLWHRRQDSTEV